MLEVHLRTNDSCNLKCLHCYSRSITSGKFTYMSKDEIIRLLDLFCVDLGACIHLEGGEIFLYPEAIRSLSSLKKEYLKNITLTTNGTVFTDDAEILEVLRNIGTFRISVEGHTEQQNMQLRGIALSRVLENASRYLSEDIRVCLRITMNSKNYGGIVKETLPSLISMGFTRIQVYEFQSVGRGYDNKHIFALGDSLREFLEALSEHGRYKGADVNIMLPAKRIPETEFYRDRLETAGIGVNVLKREQGISINPDGNVFICAWDDNSGHILFNTYHESSDRIQELLNSCDLTHDCAYCSALRLTA